MNAERFVRSLIVAAACVVTGWWLLHDSPGEDGLPPTPTPHDDDALEPRAADSGDDAAIEVDARHDQPVAEEHSADAPAVLAAAGSDAVEPIPLIEGITLPGGMWNLHTMMEREPRDAAWAEEMERHFSTYFASKPELGRNFSQPSVLCRSRFCEIQAIGYGPRAFDTWKVATEDLRDQPWGRNLRAGGIYTIERAPNEQAVVLILMRQRIVLGDRVIELQ